MLLREAWKYGRQTLMSGQYLIWKNYLTFEFTHLGIFSGKYLYPQFEPIERRNSVWLCNLTAGDHEECEPPAGQPAAP